MACICTFPESDKTRIHNQVQRGIGIVYLSVIYSFCLSTFTLVFPSIAIETHWAIIVYWRLHNVINLPEYVSMDYIVDELTWFIVETHCTCSKTVGYYLCCGLLWGECNSCFCVSCIRFVNIIYIMYIDLYICFIYKYILWFIYKCSFNLNRNQTLVTKHIHLNKPLTLYHIILHLHLLWKVC